MWRITSGGEGSTNMRNRFLAGLRNWLAKDRVIWLIFTLALLIRLYDLSSVPHGFHMDEVANAYLGRFILLNGQDIHGNRWPFMYVNKYGDYPPAIPMYLAGLSTFIFGLNELAARFPAAVIGSLAVFPVYFLFRLLVSQPFALLSALMLAILPWHVSLSRASSEAVIALTVAIWGLFKLFQGGRQKNIKAILISWPLLAGTYLLYPSFRVIVPLALAPLPIFFGENKSVKKYLLFTFVFLFSLTLLIGLTKWGRARYAQTSLFTNVTDAALIRNDLQGLIFDDGGTSNLYLVRAYHNKLIGYAQRLFEQYFYYFAPNFLFVKGGSPYRYNIPHVGLIYLSFGIFLLSFLFPVNLRIERKTINYFLYLLLFGVLPVAITVDDTPNIHRLIFWILPVIFFLVLGLWRWLEMLKRSSSLLRYLAVSCFLGLFALELIYCAHQYYQHAGSSQAYKRTDGNKQLALWLIDRDGVYSDIFAPQVDWLPVYYLFYRNDFSLKYIGTIPDDFKISKIDNIRFLDNVCPSRELPEKTSDPVLRSALVVDQGDCELFSWYRVVAKISRRDGTIAFKLLVRK